ncbi:GNAT family N-acetyltransferase [Lutispora thermophila]|uniref:Protein N-acetyltransferase, RimJ/RimL family n=1 Tax=Lutispora thermophila DSM 19022 TaxID=1122184 RepID=A0A1M6FXL6_9FIRM|nr:GNAT family protein [Lutispora thermophila]SHJ02402.1 Protein N-acetyltransferase, RimJ/RimL family [Lutispora thermophila DSM 19022]
MSALRSNYIKTFADEISHLYYIFFKRYPVFKLFISNILFHSSGNFGLSIVENDVIIGNYTIYNTNEGNIVKEGLDNKVSVRFKVQKSIFDDVMNNKSLYASKPYKLLKFVPALLSSVQIVKKRSVEKYLRGNKVILRQGCEKDLFYLHNWYNDKELNKLAGWTEGKIGTAQLRMNLLKGFGYDPMNLIIETIDGGKPIGTIQLYDFNETDQSCKLGIRIGDRDYWGKGYGEDAIKALLRYAFYELDIFRVSLKLYEYNERASRCYLKCGFKYEGRTRKSAYIDGKFYDEILMGALKSEFISQFDKD